MKRALLAAFVAALLPAAWVQGDDDVSQVRTPMVRNVTSGDTVAAAKRPGNVLVAVHEEAGNGHIVVAVPGKSQTINGRLYPRVYDGNFVVAIRDARNGIEKLDPKAQGRLYAYLQEKNPGADYNTKKGAAADAARLKDMKAWWDKLPGTPEQKSADLLAKYAKEGNLISRSFDKTKLGRTGYVEWYARPGDPTKVEAQVTGFKGAFAKVGDCSQFVNAALGTKGVANEQFKAYRQQADDGSIKRFQLLGVTPPPRCEEPRAQSAPGSMQRSTINRPGGTILAATAVIEEIHPASAETATFDPKSGTLAITLRSGEVLRAHVDADDFVVAVRTVFRDKTDPVLNIGAAPEKPGFWAVDYTGPLFETHLGSVLFEADELLGGITFRPDDMIEETVLEVLPEYEDLLELVSFRSARVFLEAREVRFRAPKDGVLECARCACAVSVEGNGGLNMSHGLERLGRAVSERFDLLAEKLDAFADFKAAAEAVALAKWLKVSSAAFDWAAVSALETGKVEFPGYVPMNAWRQKVLGRTLNGWRVVPDEPSCAAPRWERTEEGFVLEATETCDVVFEEWHGSFDLRASVTTRGRVFPVVEQAPAKGLLDLDTKGERQELELFVRDRHYTVAGESAATEGDFPGPWNERKPLLVGFRVFKGSTITLHGVEVIGR
jgi:hypothetical protein